jgi:hypothetical protein
LYEKAAHKILVKLTSGDTLGPMLPPATNFYLLKKSKIANSSKMAKAREKISTHLESLEI